MDSGPLATAAHCKKGLLASVVFSDLINRSSVSVAKVAVASISSSLTWCPLRWRIYTSSALAPQSLAGRVHLPINHLAKAAVLSWGSFWTPTDRLKLTTQNVRTGMWCGDRSDADREKKASIRAQQPVSGLCSPHHSGSIPGAAAMQYAICTAAARVFDLASI